MKLELTNDTKIAIWKIGNAALMCQDNDITSAKYEEISLEAMNEANDAYLKNSNCNIPRVVGSALKDDERVHYEALQDCCKKILKAVDSGKVPQRGIMGLRLLMPK